MSKTDANIAARIAELPEGSLRRRALEGARRFKASWVELGRLLSEVRNSGSWRAWGFPSFEGYCAKELFIRRQTAEKLTASYGFLQRHEPGLVKEGAPGRAPPFEVIDVLSRAEAQGRLPSGGWKELRDEVMERPPRPAALSRQLAERYGPPQEKARAAPAAERVERIAGAARRLADACEAEKSIPRGTAQRARSLAEEIEAIS